MTSSLRLAKPRQWWVIAAVSIAAVLVALLTPAQQARADGVASAAGAGSDSVASYGGLSPAQRADLMSIARDTWKFYSLDVDPATSLPMDNISFAGGSATPTAYGHYTSAANIGVYLWAVVAANDLGLVGRPQARAMIEATLTRCCT
jgi:hypothetical protein